MARIPQIRVNYARAYRNADLRSSLSRSRVMGALDMLRRDGGAWLQGELSLRSWRLGQPVVSMDAERRSPL